MHSALHTFAVPNKHYFTRIAFTPALCQGAAFHGNAAVRRHSDSEGSRKPDKESAK